MPKSPVSNPTNKQVIQRLYNSHGALRCEHTQAPVRKYALIEVVRCAGMANPARCTLRVREGVGVDRSIERLMRKWSPFSIGWAKSI
jgi:hypothetical protein